MYVQPEDFDKFVASLLATFGGTATKQGVFTVTPTPSKTMSQLVLTPAGTLSVFGFKTPVPYPFGVERTGYLVTNLDAAVRAAQADGADVLVSPFDDPIGRDAVIQWPGGVNMQLYWHTTPPSYPALKTIPENRVYVSPERVQAFVHSFLGVFARESCFRRCPRAGYRDRPRVRYLSPDPDFFGLRRDGSARHRRASSVSVWPRDDGYEVANLADTLGKAKAAGVSVLSGPYSADGRNSAMVQFPGGYIAEIHSASAGK